LREYHISTFRSVRALAHQTRFARHIAQRGIDIVHAYSFYGNVFAIPPARIAGAPVVIASIRDLAPYLTPAQKHVQRLVCRYADCVLVNADAVRNWLISERYDPSKIVVIRNGVDVSPCSRERALVRLLGEFGLSQAPPVVGVVSRLTRLKGLEAFLEAAAIVAARFPAARFLVVGETSPDDGAYRTELTTLARKLGVLDRVVFTGLRTDARELLAGLTVSVMPSLNEGLSNVLLESMAAGVPVGRDARRRHAGGHRRRRQRPAGAGRRRERTRELDLSCAGAPAASGPAGPYGASIRHCAILDRADGARDRATL
jgi:glycosyltransferase involved in cell wall biosynthesis